MLDTASPSKALVNTQYYYESNMIIKVWEVYLQAKECRFYINQQRIQSTFMNELSFSVEAVLVVNADGSLYKPSHYTLSIADEINSINHTGQIGLSNNEALRSAIDQIIDWNRNHPPESRVLNHRIIFPYQRLPNHWCLGELSLNFSDTLLRQAKMMIYEPLSTKGEISENIRERFQKFISEYSPEVILEIQLKFTKQQQDSTSCGVISAENGKLILDGDENPDFRRYEAGAFNVRRQHIQEVNLPAFIEKQEGSFAEFLSKTNQNEDKNFSIKELLLRITKLNNKTKKRFHSALERFMSDHEAVCGGQIVDNPYQEVKTFFDKVLLHPAKEDCPAPQDKSTLQELFDFIFVDEKFKWTEEGITFLGQKASSIQRALIQKQESTAAATGGEGTHYESKVQAYFYMTMLTGKSVLPGWSGLERLYLQARSRGHQTDDAVAHFGKTSVKKMLVQAKITIDFIPSDSALKGALEEFWIDFNNPESFSPKDDVFVLAFQNVDPEKLNAANKQLEGIKHEINWWDYFEKEEKKRRDSEALHPRKRARMDKELDFFQLVKEILAKIEAKIPDIKIFNFVSKIKFLQLDLEGKDLAVALDKIREATSSDEGRARAIWARLTEVCSDCGYNAGGLAESNSPEEVRKLFKPPSFHCKPQHNTGNLDQFGSSNFPTIGDNEGLVRDIDPEVIGKFSRTQQLVLCGLNGVGKTRLGLSITDRSQELFEGVRARLYFDASSKEILTNQYIALSEEANLPLEQYRKNPPVLKSKVVEWLGRQTGLFLFFDNARNKRELAAFLPRPEGNRFLITSTSRSFKKDSHIEIKLLTPAQAREFIKKELQDSSSNDKNLDSLSEVVGQLILALAQACAYIRYTGCSIAEYCERYKAKKRGLLDPSEEGAKLVDHVTVYCTWDLSFDHIKSELPEANELLEYLIHLNHRSISLSFIKDFFSELIEEDKIERSLNLLNDYSLVTRNQDNQGLSMHFVLKEVMLEKQREKKEVDKKNHTLLERFLSYFQYTHSSTEEEISKLRRALIHLDTLLASIKDSKILTNYLSLLITLMRFYQDALNDSSRLEYYLKTVAPLMEGDKLEVTLVHREQLLWLQSKNALRKKGGAEKAQEYFSEYEKLLGRELDVYELCHKALILVNLRPKTSHPKLFQRDSGVQDTAQISDKDQISKNVREAEEHLKKALELTKESSRERAMVLYYIGSLYLRRNVNTALQRYEASLKIRIAISKTHKDTLEREIARVHHQLGVCFARKDEKDKALKEFKTAYEIRKRYPNAQETIASLSQVIYQLHQEMAGTKKKRFFLEEIYQHLKELLKLKEDVSLSIDKILYLCADVLLRLDRRSEALEAFNRIQHCTKAMEKLGDILNSEDIRDKLGLKEIIESLPESQLTASIIEDFAKESFQEFSQECPELQIPPSFEESENSMSDVSAYLEVGHP